MGFRKTFLYASTIPLVMTLAACDEYRLDKTIEMKNLRHTLKVFQAIGEHNNGTRESGTAGHTQSLDYIKYKLRNKYDVYEDDFEYQKFVELSSPELDAISPEAHSYTLGEDFNGMTYSGSGEASAELVAIDLVLPPAETPNTSNSGCEAEDYFDDMGNSLVTGKIALVQRGSCTFAAKVVNAQNAGALAVVLFNEGQPGRTDAIAGTLGNADSFSIPAVGASFAVGNALNDQLQMGEVTLHVKAETEVQNITGHNLIAESRYGNPDSIVMIGSHLDSVHEGPGINDNGSGSAAVFELAQQMYTGRHLTNKVRFAWWDAEEGGLIGSRDYTANLSPEEVAKISLYINLDMIASPNYAHLVYSSEGMPEGSDVVAGMLSQYFLEQGLPFEMEGAINGRSDHAGFIDLGIANGGLFTGAEVLKTEAQVGLYGGEAGVALDHCYHQACDDITNINWQVFTRMTKAAAYAFGQFAMREDPVGLSASSARFAYQASSAVRLEDMDYRGHWLVR